MATPTKEINQVIRVGNTLTNLIDKQTKQIFTADKVTTYYDGTPMTDAKVDGYIYRKAGSEYFLKNLGKYEELFLEKDTVAQLRDLSATEVLLLKMGYYKGVTLNGYYNEGDTPAPIQYYLSDTVKPDDGGSVFSVGGIKLKHEFKKGVDIRYFGAKCNGYDDDTVFIQKAIDSVNNIVIPSGLDVLWNGQVNLRDNSIVSGVNSKVIRSEQGSQIRFMYAEDKSNIRISGSISFNGVTDSEETPGYHSSNSAGRFIRCEGVYISGVDVSRMSSAFQFQYGRLARIDNCNISRNVLTGISAFNHDTKVRGCTFDSNGRISAGLTHDVYFINSDDVEISKNTFRNHLDPLSSNVVYRWDGEIAETEGFEDAKNCIIDGNDFGDAPWCIDINTLNGSEPLNTRKPTENVTVSNNYAPNGKLRFVMADKAVSRNNIVDHITYRGGVGVAGSKTSLKSINDKLNYIETASIGAAADIDTSNIQFIDTSFSSTDGVVFRQDSGWGGFSSCTILNPVMQGLEYSTLFSPGFLASIKNGRVKVVSSGFLKNYSDNSFSIETNTVYTPDNSKEYSENVFLYSLESTPITINPPVESVNGTEVTIVIRKTGTPNYVGINFNGYKLSQKTLDILNTNTSNSLLSISFICINSEWVEKTTDWVGNSEAVKNPLVLGVNTRFNSTGVVSGDSVVKISASSSPVIFNNIPLSSSKRGRIITFIKEDDTVNTITISPQGSDSIVGAVSPILRRQWDSVTLISDGDKWISSINAISAAVADVTTADAIDEATAITLVNELKAKINAMLASDRASGQRAT